ncbi:MAG: hypothetical protein COB54_08300 [Alphaproteobacteria bacterium]|nr:MAG: hypothetical protein COB54_08300 [Alphaproteobacteria bacterium]
MTKTTLIKFTHVSEQTEGSVTRIVGLVKAEYLFGLFDIIDLEANPRSAKTGSVTDDIIESINDGSDIFPFKTKGILIGTAIYTPLERKRYKLQFEDPETEGVLDGGHNMLAIGIHFLSKVISDLKELNRIKTWSLFKRAWNKYRTRIEKIKSSFNFLVPVEVLVPSDLNDSEIVDHFNNSLLDICAARNNNVQLTPETKANKKGFYNELREALPPTIAKNVEWKTNDGGSIKVRDLIALAWMPLNVLNDEGLLPIEISTAPQNIYRNKGECSKLFSQLMENENVSKTVDGNYEHELTNPIVRSAIKILGDIPKLYDKIYADFPEAYNKAVKARFGRNPIVRIYDPGNEDGTPKYLKSEPKTKFTYEGVKYSYPDGLIMPLIYALTALMKVERDEIIWATDPVDFLDLHFETILRSYKTVFDMGGFDPQKIGKNEGMYDFTVDRFKMALKDHLG